MQAREIVMLGEKILDGGRITADEALALEQVAAVDIPVLAAYANKIRDRFCGSGVDLCGIVNARSGMCSENCKFCAQSVFHHTNAPVYGLVSNEKLVAAAKQAEKQGARRVSVVTSGKGMENDPDFPRILAGIRAVMAATKLKVCANLGTISQEQAYELAAAGVKRYAHNLETSERFYPQVCTSHPYSERVATVRAAKKAGMELCTGGIIGLGETWADRVSLAFTLRDLDVDSIPINILNPIPGTALEGQKPPAPLESIKTVAMFRFVLPDKVIRPAGGRELNLRDLQGALMLAGANGLLLGNYLTFTGRDAAMDLTMVHDVELEPMS